MRNNSEKKVQMSHWRAGKRLKSERVQKEPVAVAGVASVAAINLGGRNKVGDEIRRRKKEESARGREAAGRTKRARVHGRTDG